MKYYSILCFIILGFLSCESESKMEKEIAKIDVNFNVERFDVAFAESSPEQLSELKKGFPFMFPNKYKDAFWIQRMQDTIQQELVKETVTKFKDFESHELEIKQLFQHLKYYFPDEFNTPRVITTTSSVDYRNKFIVTDTIALISLDTYLGSDHHFYRGIQEYIVANLKPDQMVVDMAKAYADRYIFQQKRKTLLDDMIYFGKQLYFKDKMVPFKTDAEKIGYTKEEMQWAEASEEFVWRYFIDKELLYSTESKLAQRFINLAPFSKFYLKDVDNESPGRIGQYIGWQIVKAYMAATGDDLKRMLNTTPETIFNKSKFKPRKNG